MKPIPLTRIYARLSRYTNQYAAFLIMGCLMIPLGGRAADTWSLPSGAIDVVNWQDATWSKNSVVVPGQYPGSPGGSATDLIVTSNIGGGSTGTLYTNGSHIIGGFDKQGTAGLSIQGYISENNSSPRADLLTINGALKVSGGTLNILSRKAFQTLGVSAATAEIASSGTLNLGAAGTPLSTVVFGTTTIHQNGTVRIHQAPSVDLGFVNLNGLLSLANTDSVTSGASTVTAASLSGSGAITSGSSNWVITLSITGSNASPADFSGMIENTNSSFGGVVGVHKSGIGVQIFSGANTYSGGTVISGGGLLVANETGSGLGSGAVEVKSGGWLAGSGIVASGSSIRAEDGALVAPGLGGGETAVVLRLSGESNGAAPILIMEEGAAFQFNLSTGDVSDRIDLLSYNDGDLVLDGVNGTNVNVTGIDLGTYRLFSFSNLSSTEGELLISQLRLGSGFAGFEQSSFFYLDHAIHLNAVPEPSALALMGLAMAGIGWCRWQRKSR